MSAQTTPIGADAPFPSIARAVPSASADGERALALLRSARMAPPEREQEFFDAATRWFWALEPAVAFRLRCTYALRTGRPLR